MTDLKPDLKFDFVPIKHVNIGGGIHQKDWLRTETFIDIVSNLLKEDDVKTSGGFMVIRPKNYKGAQPFLYQKDYNHDNYDPKHCDMKHEMNVFGVQNLKTYFKAQIHDQKCKEICPQIFKWNDDDNTLIEEFQYNNNNNDKCILPFDIITNALGQEITQTQSGRIVKVYRENVLKRKRNDIHTSPNKKRKIHNINMNRGFSCVIQQIERKYKKRIEEFWDKKLFTQQLAHSIYDGATPEQIPLIFCEYLKSAETVQYAIIDSQTTYHFESPLQLAHLSRYGPFSVLHNNEFMLGIQVPYVYIGQQHAFFAFHREDMNLFAVNHLLWGQSKVWYCVHPNDHERVLHFVRKQYKVFCGCESPLQHKVFWFDPYILLSMGIRVFFIRQNPGDIVITPPGGIHGGLNTGPNMAESINFMTYDITQCWKPVLSAMLYHCHNFECNVCINHAFLDINRLAMRLRDKKDDQVPNKEVIYDALPMDDYPQYKNADQYISRSFTWNNRLSLQCRYFNSNEYKEFNAALRNDTVYPYYLQESEYKVVVCPIRYNGTFKHTADTLIFEPMYSISYLNDEKKANQYISLEYVLKEFSIDSKEWDHQFDEEAIKLKLYDRYSANINVVFLYKKQIISSVERRKKMKSKRVIVDSDTESD